MPPSVVELLTGVHDKLSGIMPILAGTSIGYMLSFRYRLPHLPTAFLHAGAFHRHRVPLADCAPDGVAAPAPLDTAGTRRTDQRKRA
ncbi:hypothetical protein G6F22_020398 [Rhizopus arrhizus]|nr:hypothetical protein G6F22_020398 [Rhizopus arrhizus]